MVDKHGSMAKKKSNKSTSASEVRDKSSAQRQLDFGTVFTSSDHIERIVKAYQKFKDIDGFARVITTKAILEKNGNLSVLLYVAMETIRTREQSADFQATALPDARNAWLKSSADVWTALQQLLAGADK